MRFLLATIVIVNLIVSCGARGELGYAPSTSAVSKANIRDILVATTRARLPDKVDFSAGRSAGMSFARFGVSIPATHQQGAIEWPDGSPDPVTDFVLTYGQLLTKPAFFQAINQRSARQNIHHKEAVIFIHGYNSNFSEGLYRFAQMSHDINTPAIEIFYSWPSAGEGKGYAYDRESVIFARDGLQHLIENLAQTDVKQITLVAHSLGGYLAVETLRQMSLQGRLGLNGKLDTVALLSPDIDLDVFRQQISRIAPLPNNFVIFVSDKDRALRFSNFLSGGKNRLGMTSNLQALHDLDVTVINMSEFGGEGDKLGHFTAATSPTMLSMFRNRQAMQAIVRNASQQRGRNGPKILDVRKILRPNPDGQPPVN